MFYSFFFTVKILLNHEIHERHALVADDLVAATRASAENSMKKKEFISKVAKRAGCTQETARNILYAIKSVIDEQLVTDGSARLPLFGTFTVKTRASWYIFHPRTRERILTRENVYVRFKPSSKF